MDIGDLAYKEVVRELRLRYPDVNITPSTDMENELFFMVEDFLRDALLDIADNWESTLREKGVIK